MTLMRRKRVTFTPTPEVHRLLQELVSFGVYGRTVSDVADRLVCQALTTTLVAHKIKPGVGPKAAAVALPRATTP